MSAPYKMMDNNHTDEELIHLMKKGEEKAFNELYNRYWESLSLYVLKILKLKEEARDIVQEIFLSIWKRREVLDIKFSTKSYLFRSARNLAIRHLEKQSGRSHILSKLPHYFEGTEEWTAAEMLELKELEQKVDKAVDSLPPKMKEAYLLSRMENRSYKEIAAELKIATTTVKKQISNALKVIKKEVNDPKLLLYGFLFL